MRLETLTQDLRIGLRVLVKERAFAALAIFVLALGIAAVTTQFSVVNAVVLRGFSFPNADRLAAVRFIDPASRTAFGVNGRIYAMDFEEFRHEQQSFERIAAYLSGSTVNMTVNGAPQRYTGAYVTEDFLRILGVAPIVGRDFEAGDNEPGAPKVALIGHGIWQRDFGGASDIVDRTVRINGAPAAIIGVLPSGFTFPTNEELWLPLYGEFPVRPRNDPRANSPAVIGLLKAGVSVKQAEAEMGGFAQRFAQAYPDTNKQFDTGQVEPLREAFTPQQLKGTLYTMLAFCAGVLLIACVNVMNMQFARATLRARELAVRSSLGATWIRLLRQMLTESLLLATVGAALGIGLAYLSVDWLSATVRNMDNPPPAWIVFDLDVRVLTFTVVATMAAAVLSGLLPAWMASRVSAVTVLKEGGRGSTSRSVGLVTRGLVVLQIVVTCVLLIGSLLQLKSLTEQQRIDYGYDTGGILAARMGLMDADYPTPESRKVFYDRVLRELPASPEFEAVALTNRMRMVFSGNGPIEIEGVAYTDRRDRPNTHFEQVSPGFFDLMGMRIVDGRGFNAEDMDFARPVAIVNAAFARKHFGAEGAIGRRFRTGDGSTPQYGPWRTIVGVVSTVRMMGPFNNPNVDESGFYVPFYSPAFGPAPEAPLASQFATVAVTPRPGQRPEALVNALRREINKIDPNLPLYYPGTPKQHLEGAIAGSRVIATMFTVFGGIAIVLAAVGIYGVMSFSVSRRTQEFGVRMALGADHGRILGMVLKQGSWQIAIGLLIGLGLSLLLATLGGAAIANSLYNVSPRDPMIYGTVFLLVALVSLTALLVPGQRASRVDPLVALRAE
jgi:putative ABC transport system permease protein